MEVQGSVFMHLIPFNEHYAELKKVGVVNVKSLSDVEIAKGFIAAKIKDKLVVDSCTNEFREMLLIKSSTPYEKEILLKYHLLGRYSLLRSDLCEYDKIDLTPYIESLFEKDLMHFLFRTTIKLGAQVQSIILNNKHVFLIKGSDLIRLARWELSSYEVFNQFFDNYEDWPYVVEVDVNTYSRVVEALEISLVANLEKSRKRNKLE